MRLVETVSPYLEITNVIKYSIKLISKVETKVEYSKVISRLCRILSILDLAARAQYMVFLDIKQFEVKSEK